MTALAEAIANKLLHPALTALKKGDGEKLAEALVELFGLTLEEARLMMARGERSEPRRLPRRLCRARMPLQIVEKK